MMKKTKGLIFCLLLSMLLLGIATSCAPSGDDLSDDGKMKISIGLWDIEAALSGENDKIVQTLEEKFNVELVPVNITWDDYSQKIQLWASGGTLPDIFSHDKVGTSDFYQWVDQGVVKALPNDLSDLPNLEEYLALEDFQAQKVDGSFFHIPRRTYPAMEWSTLDRVILYRWDLAQAAGVTKEPTTWDEFADMILKIIKADPEGKNISGLTSTTPKLIEGFLFNYSLPSSEKWVEKDGTYMPAYFAYDGLPTFELARKWYELGVIEKDIALTKLNQAEDKFLKGQSAALLKGNGTGGLHNTMAQYWEELYPGKTFLGDVKLLPLLSSPDGNKYYPTFGTGWSESYISSKVSDEKMNRILKIYDYLISKEGSTMLTYGFEGEDYDIVDGVLVPRDITGLLKKYPSTGALSSLVEWNKSGWDSSLPPTEPKEYREMAFAKVEEAKTEGTMIDFDLRYEYLSTPLKDAFIMDTGNDLLSIMMGEKPVKEMYEDLLAEYERQGLSVMINEVNEAAKKLSYQ